MTPRLPAGRAARRALTLGLAATTTVLAVGLPAGARLETWREESSSAFGKAKRERVVVSDTGLVRLGHALKPVGTLDAARVWDLAADRDGNVYAATGDDGKVFTRDAGEDASWSLAYDAGDTQALSLAVGPGGHVFAGTGPTGQVVDLTDPKHPASRPHADVQYVWDLAADPSGNLYAATGPTGQLWKRSAAGEWSLLYDSKHAHLLCVAVAPDGSVHAGSDGEGVIYKVAPGGKVSVLYDAPQGEVRALLVGRDGTVYAGTAVESGGGSSRGSSFGAPGGSGGGSSGRTRAELSAGRAEPLPAQKAPEKGKASKKESEKPSPSAGGSAAPRPPSPGDNAVYRIDADGVAREIFRARALVYALALRGDRLVVGTGPEGQLYELLKQGQESAPVARLDNGQVLSLLNLPDGGLLIGTGDPGSVVRLAPGYVRSGTLTSGVRDTKLVSRFGALAWKSEQPRGTQVSVSVRSGNVSEPDATWSDWSPGQTNPAHARAHVPPGRFVQYRATLSTDDPAVTPELSSVTLRYQTANLAPEFSKLDVPDVSTLDGATRQTRLTFRWDVSDPNDDDLEYQVQLRKEGWPDWVTLNPQPVTEKSFAWDTTSVPVGTYRVRVVASDRPSNNPDDALTGDRVSDTFLVDHEAPAVTVTASPRRATVVLKDALTRIVKAAYAVDGGDWVPVFPDDGLYDTGEETLTISLADLKPGVHVLVVRATDAAGNVGAGDVLIEVQ